MLFRAVEWLEITFSDFLLWTVTYSRQSFSLIALLYNTTFARRFVGAVIVVLIWLQIASVCCSMAVVQHTKNKKWEVFIISRWNIAIMAWSDVWVDNKSAILPHCVAVAVRWSDEMIFMSHFLLLFNSNRLITTWFAFFYSFAHSWDDTDTQHRHLVVIVAWNANVHKVPFKKKWGKLTFFSIIYSIMLITRRDEAIVAHQNVLLCI